MKIIKITSENKHLYNEKLIKFEKLFRYGLGRIEYEVDHGEDYYAFFESMGELVSYIAVDGEDIAALAVGVLREVILLQDEPPKKVWYIADLKVAPNYRGQRLTHMLIRRAYIDNFAKAQKIYALSINRIDNESNHVTQFAPRLPLLPLKVSSTFFLYLCSFEEMEKVEPVLKENSELTGYVNVMKTKTLVSNGAPIPILHAYYAPHQSLHTKPQKGFNHMFCIPEENALNSKIQSLGITPVATAAALYYGGGSCDWKFIISSEI